MEDSQEEPHRRSMYEVSKDIRESKNAVSRVLYIGRLNVEDRHHKIDIGEDMNKWVKERQPGISGLCISTGNYCVHFIEASSELIFQHIQWVQQLLRLDTPPFTGVNVIAFTEENPKKMFGYWSSITLPPTSSGEEEPAQINVEEMCWQLYNNMNTVGTRLSMVFGNDQTPSTSGLAAAIKSKSKELIPHQELLNILMSDKFPSIADFIGIYILPLDIVFDNELVWPCPPELTF
ncbi:unnamed protein product [Blepharisma stoltei]|uniref:BLUF domain-containing protein n=1 Tax=Blepharisma stoltei TaxID=1481888 RepID=A0AAU9JA47_9CILI|nr:unnamed protein product [Blepharisma stoltei]